MPVFHQETAGNYAQLRKAQFFIQAQGWFIGADHGIELQNPEAQFFCLFHTVFYQNFADTLAPFTAFHGITGIADMPATTDVVGMQDIQANHVARAFFNCHARMGLGKEKIQSALFVQLFHLREGDTVFNNFIPDVDSAFNIVRSEFSRDNSHFDVPSILSLAVFENYSKRQA